MPRTHGTAHPIVGTKLLLAALAAAAVLAPGAAHGGGSVQASLRPCGDGTPALCGTVTVPLDPAGRLPGTTRIPVEELPPAEPATTPAPVMFLVSGGPGQASTSSFDLRHPSGWLGLLQQIFRGYTLVAFDDRGTGTRGRINCPSLASGFDTVSVDACIRHLGARSTLYSSWVDAADLEAIRAALGADRIGIYGVSYGSRQALVYAYLHPDRVDTLVLDSVSPVEPDLFGLDELQALPRVLGELCRGACRRVTRQPGAELIRLANRLAANPVAGEVPQPGGQPQPVNLGAWGLIDLAFDADLDPGIAAELTAAVHAGLAGDLAPLERLLPPTLTTSHYLGINETVEVATICNDGPFPWPAGKTIAGRLPYLLHAINSVPEAAIHPYGRWTTYGPNAEACLRWPSSPPAAAFHQSSLPHTRVLLLSGSLDVRTPTSDARHLAATLAHARLLVVKGSPHGVLVHSRCVQKFIADWLARDAQGACPTVPLVLAPVGPLPLPGAGNGRLSAARTLALVRETLLEAEATANAYNGARPALFGLAGGTLHVSGDRLTFRGYSDLTGISLWGTVAGSGAAVTRYSGRIVVAGKRAAHGPLAVDGERLTGRLEGP